MQTHASSSNVDQRVVLGEIVEDVPLRPVGEDEEAGYGHAEAGDDGEGGRDVCYAGEAVERGRAEGAVDEERVVVAAARGVVSFALKSCRAFRYSHEGERNH